MEFGSPLFRLDLIHLEERIQLVKMLTGLTTEDGVLLVIELLIDAGRLVAPAHRHQGLGPQFGGVVVLLTGDLSDAVGIEQCHRGITPGHLVAGHHLVIVVQAESGVRQMSMMAGGVESCFGIIETI